MRTLFDKLRLFALMVTVNLQLFDDDTQVSTMNTTGNDISPEMRTYYHDRLIDHAEPKLVHAQFGQEADIPSGSGKTIEFRKYPPLKKALRKLQEGITPVGNKLDYTTLYATPDQYGDFTKISDVLNTVAADKQVVIATKRHGSQAGRTLDTVVREVITAGTNKLMAPVVAADGTETEVLLREDITEGCYLTSDLLDFAAAKLERENTEKIGESWVAIIHTDTKHGLLRELGEGNFINVMQYAKPENMLRGEIGTYAGIRFVETTEAKIIGPADMLGIEGYTRTSLNAAVADSADIYPVKPFSAVEAVRITADIAAGTVYTMYVDEVERAVSAVTGGAVGVCKITLTEAITADAGDMVCGTGAGKDGSAIYCTLIIGADAYGVTKIQGLGLEHIVKQLGSAGSADPLNQRATVGWKATSTAVRLMEEYMIRIEHTTKRFRLTAESNMY